MPPEPSSPMRRYGTNRPATDLPAREGSVSRGPLTIRTGLLRSPLHLRHSYPATRPQTPLEISGEFQTISWKPGSGDFRNYLSFGLISAAWFDLAGLASLASLRD